MAELAYATDLKSVARKGLGVRLPSPAPITTLQELRKLQMKKVCEKCGLEISIQNFSRHSARCTGDGLRWYIKQALPDSFVCTHCGKECKNLNSLRQHEVRCSNNPNRKSYNNLAVHAASRKGTTKFNNPTVAKQANTLHSRYEKGELKSNGFAVLISFDDYVYGEHNEAVINEWLECVADVTVAELAADQRSIDAEGYVRIKNLRRSSNDSTNMLLSFEHEYIANQLINNRLESINTVHHINRIRDDNTCSNLLVFVDKANHLRYHTSRYAWLIFDPETLLFSCEIRK